MTVCHLWMTLSRPSLLVLSTMSPVLSCSQPPGMDGPTGRPSLGLSSSFWVGFVSSLGGGGAGGQREGPRPCVTSCHSEKCLSLVTCASSLGPDGRCGRRHLPTCLLLRHLETVRGPPREVQLAATGPRRSLLPAEAGASGIDLSPLPGTGAG